jgi:26S proteasome regulatory subunit N2
MALGIACAGSGNAEAISLVEPLLKDTAGYVRQGACIAMALIMMQQRNDHPKTKFIRDHYIKVIGDKHQDVLSKFGAIYAQGILESGGRNVNVRVINEEGHLRLQSVVGMLIFTQFWFWFPLGHFISLAFTPTALVCVNTDLKMPVNIKIRSNAPPSHFAYPPMTEPPKEKSKEKVETAVLSITSKVKAKGKQRKSEGGTSGDGPEKMDVDKPAAEEGDKEATDSKKEAGDGEAEKDGEDGKEGEKEKEKEADFELLKNPARVLPAQLSVVTFGEEERYSPIRSGPVHSGVVVMTDKKTGEPEELIEITKGPEEVADVAEEAKPPEPFTFDPELEDESM